MTSSMETWPAMAAIATFAVITLFSSVSQGVSVPPQCNTKSDVLFIIDASGSVDETEFRLQLEMLSNLTTTTHVGLNGTLYSVIIFGSTAERLFDFNKYTTNSEIQQAILSISYTGGSTNTAEALNIVRTQAFLPETGSRSDVPHLVVILTDGCSDDYIATETQATLVKQSGISSIIAVAIGQFSAFLEELKKIVSSPSLLLVVSDYQALASAIGTVAHTICEEQKKAVITPSCISRDNGCVGKLGGNHRACDPDCQRGIYYSCSNEFSYKMECPLAKYKGRSGSHFHAKMLYNEKTKSCEQEVTYCPRVHEDYAEVPPPETTSPQQTQPRSTHCLSPTESCKGKPNGNYPLCFPACVDGLYVQCSNNERHLMPCPDGHYTYTNGKQYQRRTVYNAETDRCELTCSSCQRSAEKQPDETPQKPLPEKNPPTDESTSTRVIQDCDKPADLLIVIDSSSSIGLHNFEIILEFTASFTSHLKIGPQAFQISVLIYSTDVFSLFRFTDLNSTTIPDAIRSAPYLEQGTDTALALLAAMVFSFSAANGARDNVAKYAIVITDGASNDENQTISAADQLKATGVKVLTVGIGCGPVMQELRAIASSPDYVFEVNNFDVLGAIKSSLLDAACDKSQPITSCVANSCRGRADGDYPACEEQCKHGIYYTCSHGYSVERKCGLGTYTKSNKTIFHALMVYNPETVSCELESEYCLRNPEQYKVIPPPAKPPTPPVNPYNPTCISSLESCKNKPDGNYAKCYPDCMDGTYIACSSGETIQMPCAMAYYFDKERQERFLGKMVYDPVTGQSAEHADYCPRDVKTIRREYNPDTSTECEANNEEIPQCTTSTKLDIVFVMDTSASIGINNYVNEINFVQSVTQYFNVGPDAVQFGLINFASTPVLEFPLNAFSNKQDLWQRLLTVKYMGTTTDTAAALKLAKDVAYTKANGARDGAVRIALVITDGISQDPPATIVNAESLRREAGVIVYVVAVGPAVRSAEISAIATSSSHIFNIQKLCQMNSIKKQLVAALCQNETTTKFICITDNCGGHSDGNYPACAPDCAHGHYFTCSNKITYKKTCGPTWYIQNGAYLQRPGVFDFASNGCQDESKSCPRETEVYE